MAGTGGLLLAPSLGCDTETTLPDDPFTLGVASGDPLPDRVMLWTRLAPDPLAGGGMPPRPVPVVWEVAHDEGFRVIVRAGIRMAWPAFGHALKVDAEGLEPDRWYWYRFRVGPWVSPVGRTRTLPAVASAPGLLRFASCSCQRYTSGFYTAFHHMAQEDLDLVVHVGDYIYESGATGGGVRQHLGGRLSTLDDYRKRYALYKLDPDLQEAHRQFPWILTWDDHEVSNNYAGLQPDENGAEAGKPPEAFAELRSRAYQAWFESLPVRVPLPQGPFLPIFRRFDYGDLARLHVLDTRQYRSNQPCMDQPGPACAGFPNPTATMLGDEQEAWLLDGLGASACRWDVLAQQVVFVPTPFFGVIRNFDQWDGYPLARQRILDAASALRNFIVLSGDIHATGIAAVPASEQQLDRPIGSEFVATGISSTIGDPTLAQLLQTGLQGLPHVVLADAGLRGYLRHEVSRSEWRCDLRQVATVSSPISTIATTASFVVADGVPGPQPI